MKGTGKIIAAVAAISALFLLYVHEHFLVFHVSYELGEKNALYSKKSEEYRRLKFEVDQMKAPRLLEDKMTKMKLDLTLPKEVLVFKVPPEPDQSVRMQDVPLRPNTGRFSHFLGQWIEVAQAKTDN